MGYLGGSQNGYSLSRGSTVGTEPLMKREHAVAMRGFDYLDMVKLFEAVKTA
jgi:hypothetical protein